LCSLVIVLDSITLGLAFGLAILILTASVTRSRKATGAAASARATLEITLDALVHVCNVHYFYQSAIKKYRVAHSRSEIFFQ
jgi:hypothetical protein